jgi:Asp-tRNA(Asn)/Glu-tRNA(Gln) amidotransferase A subunit family amidase
MPLLGEDVLYLSVAELSARIQSGALSPVALTEAYLDRSHKLGGQLNAFATLTEELALRQAHTADQEIKSNRYRGPLHGIPYAAKDLLAVPGYPTTWGARPFAQQKFDYEATVITRLRQAGAVLIGKAAMIELAGGMGYRFASASMTGPAKNPWNAGCWTCGSSSGSGAIVSSALAAFAIGTETWGSIICPSGFCGISGLRPTFGRVSRFGAMALAYSMDKIGSMARSARDCALVLQTIAGHDPRDAGSLPAGTAEFTQGVSSSSPLRVGWLKDAWQKPDADVQQAAFNAVEVLRKQGAAVVADAALPDGPWEAAAGLIISVEGASAFDSLITSGKVAELVDPLGKIGGYVSQQVQGHDFTRAQRVRRIVQRKMADLFKDYDVLACATLPLTATTLETNLETELSFADPLGGIGNLCGLPAISVPCGLSSKELPIGIQFVGPVLGDANVLRAAEMFQASTDFHKQRPPVR